MKTTFFAVLLLLAAVGGAIPTEDALLAGGGSGDNATKVHDHASIMHDLETLGFIWAGVYLCNIISHYVGLTAIVFWVLFGALCVNTGLLPENPSPFMATFSELAITLVMFALGLEEDVRHFLEGIKKAWGIALIGAMGPFTCGFLLCFLFFGDVKTAIMGGLCMTATAVSEALVALKACGLSKSTAATGIMTSAVLDDLGALFLVAIIVPVVASDKPVDGMMVFLLLLKAASFFVIVAIFAKFIFPERFRLNCCCCSNKFVYKYGYRHLVQTLPSQATLLVLLTGLGFGLLAHVLGLYAGIGSYMGALILKPEYFSSEPIKKGAPKRRKRLFSVRGEDEPSRMTASEKKESAQAVRDGRAAADSGEPVQPSGSGRVSIELSKRNNRNKDDNDSGSDGRPSLSIGGAAEGASRRSIDIIPARARPKKIARSESLDIVCLHGLIDDIQVTDANSFEALLHNVDSLAMSWVGPVFFVILGTKLVIDGPLLWDCLWQIIVLFLSMLVFQFFSASMAARYVPGGFNFVESVMIGLGMLGRAELAFVVLDIAYVQYPILSRRAFYVLLFTCFCMNITGPIVITWWKPYYLGEKVFPFFMSEPQCGGMDAAYNQAKAEKEALELKASMDAVTEEGPDDTSV